MKLVHQAAYRPLKGTTNHQITAANTSQPAITNRLRTSWKPNTHGMGFGRLSA